MRIEEENWGKPMEETLKAVRDYLEKHKDIYLVFPMSFKSF